jgi:hypothetical protein
MEENPGMKLDETAAHKEFLALTKNDPDFTLFGPDTQLTLLTQRMNANRDWKLSFIKRFVVPSVKVFDESMNTDPQIFNYLFSSVNAFTGTQWNADTFPERLRIIQDEVIALKSVGILRQHSENKIQELPAISSTNPLDSLIRDNPQFSKAHALIDTAGLIRGIGREQVAERLQQIFKEKRHDIKGVVFYDSKDQLVILESGKTLPIPLKQSRLEPHERFTFYDQKHTTGSDIKQHPQAVGVVTIGKDLISRDLYQSIWRLRNIDKSQRIEFAVDDEVKKVIVAKLKEIGREVKGNLSLDDILDFAEYNQNLLQTDNNYRSFKQKAWSLLQAEAFHKIINPDISTTNILGIFKDSYQLFVQKNSRHPWDLYGIPQKSIPSSEAVANQVNQVKTSPAWNAHGTSKIEDELSRK